MTRSLDSLTEVARDFDAIVLDQWGVLHDGTRPYPGAVQAVERLKALTRLAVLSNSGKRADVNLDRIAAKGFAPDLFDVVMTSGEALWLDLTRQGKALSLYAIEGHPGDAAVWAKGLDITLVDDPTTADAILLMGLPENAETAAYMAILNATGALPVYCTNPDRASPRAGGVTVTSPGALAHTHAEAGGRVIFYGKPHTAVFRAVADALGAVPERLLMVGDSFEHDIAGGHGAGWSTAFVEGGLHTARFANADRMETVQTLAQEAAAPPPNFTLRSLS
ncbi:TIGR01459 family HAD-type hydrolase [Cognatiyoonia sp. IB215446]|uniref:TIGR01459 family HAD-type hydrolase n=1 Tax=Cognatiyoonia sp. IB215446 TaxID=3097355 RepID=UPI002A1051FD|nr:TIGR01459 family HAD-type hydrolase [Cognatiyoonia sp. IB215446]MDX8350229.1 TIGR01459 family HAD-type hydrolase [Cognatiyoonia sp. IB215446]